MGETLGRIHSVESFGSADVNTAIILIHGLNAAKMMVHSL